ncbi:glycosyltransferase [Saprospiraceae bacterium]|nr:glycosyltransferase [Saprospiraceae bacterium]
MSTDQKKPTVIVVMGYYLPGYKVGGPVVSVSNIVNGLSHAYHFKVLAADRDFGENKPYPNINSNTWTKLKESEVFYIPKTIFAFYYLIKELIKQSKSSDVLYLNSVFNPLFSGVILLAQRIGVLNVKHILVATRGELLDEALGFKSFRKTVFLGIAKSIGIYKNIFWHATTEVEKESIVKMLNVKPENVKVATNLSSFEQEMDAAISSKESDDSAILKLVFLSRVSKDKNIPFTFEVLKEVTSKVVFDVYGPIEDVEMWEDCKEKIKALPSNITVNYLGSVKKENVRNVLSLYDLFFLPTFAENYGHAIAEALSVGTPVLISDNTPWRNLKEQGVGWDINLENKNEFIQVIHEVAATTKEQRYEDRKTRKAYMLKKLSDPKIIEANVALFRFD